VQRKNVSTNENKILVKVLRQDKGYSAENYKEFPDKQWSRSTLDRLLQIQKIDTTDPAKRK